MATAGRSNDSDIEGTLLKEMLADEPFRFHFFQAVRLLERMAPERESVGRFVPLASEVVHFSAHQTTTFPASEIQSLKFEEGKPARMAVNFMGLTGPLGLLTPYYTEYILERMRRKDFTLRDFLDIFNHRAISLFYRGWKKYRSGITHEAAGGNPLSSQLLALVGLGLPGLQERQTVADETIIYYAGLFSQHPRSAIALEQILSDYFGVATVVEQFAGAWYKLDRISQSSLDESGRYSEMLGLGTVLGDEVWDQQSVVRIRLGPLSMSQYLDFLPTGTAWEPLRSMVRFYFNDQLDFEVQLVLRRDETPFCELGGLGEAGPLLGWTTWAKTNELQRDPEETILKI
jgi:type VI secretion system protein ImpH